MRSARLPKRHAPPAKASQREKSSMPGDESVIHCAASIHTQVISLRPHVAMERMGKGLKQIFTVDRITRHIIAFSHAGLAAYQRRDDRGSEARRYSTVSASGSSHRAQGRGHAR